MPRFRKAKQAPARTTESISVITDSEITISRKDGIKAEGLISYLVLGAFVFVALFYIKLRYGDTIKGHIKKAHRAIKSRKRKR